jgi:integrase
MKKIRFTETNVKKFDPRPDVDRYTVWDSELHRFGVRFDRRSGKRSFVIKYFINGRDVLKTIGDIKIGLEKARELAKIDFGTVAKNIDPLVEAKKQELANGHRFGNMIEAFAAYLAKEGRTPNYIEDVKRSLNVKFKALHPYGIGEITRAMVSTELNRIEQVNGKRSCGVARAQLSSFYSWAIKDEGFEGFNPVDGTRARNSEARERSLKPGELKLIWQATEEPSDFNTIVRLLMLTAARKSLFGSLDVDEINWDETIDVPSNVVDFGKDRTKNKKRFWLPMSKQVQAILRNATRGKTGGKVFGGGKVGFANWTHETEDLRARVNKLAGKDIEPWVLHDLRRTFMSLGQDECGITYGDADVCLHHAANRSGTGANYNFASYIKEKRVALQKWADYVDGLVHPRDLKVVAKA